MASGKKVDLKEREVYLKNNPEFHRVLKRFEIENYLYDKEVLKKYCVSNGLKFDEDMYNSIVNDIALDNLKDKTGKIKECCNITTSINKEQFKKKFMLFYDNESIITNANTILEKELEHPENVVQRD